MTTVASGDERHATHTFEHTGELRVRLDAPSAKELFAEALRALAEIALGSKAAPTPLGAPERVTLKARDRDALLVDWMNELVFRSETEKRIFVEVEVDRLSDQEISASVRGREVAELRTLVKAATLHEVHIVENGDGLTATVTLDI